MSLNRALTPRLFQSGSHGGVVLPQAQSKAAQFAQATSLCLSEPRIEGRWLLLAHQQIVLVVNAPERRFEVLLGKKW